MADPTFLEFLEGVYSGEIFGEAFFAAMAEARDDAEEARKLRMLEQLERETGALVRAALRQAGSSPEPDPAQAEQGRAAGAGLGKAPWPDLLTAMRPELVRFVEEFRSSEALAPPGEEALAQHVTRHEQALLDFVDAELAADGSDSLASVRAILRS